LENEWRKLEEASSFFDLILSLIAIDNMLPAAEEALDLRDVSSWFRDELKDQRNLY